MSPRPPADPGVIFRVALNERAVHKRGLYYGIDFFIIFVP